MFAVEITKPATQVVINCSVLPSLITILATPHENLRKEACWAISNITAGNRVQIQVYVLYRLSECNVLDRGSPPTFNGSVSTSIVDLFSNDIPEMRTPL